MSLYRPLTLAAAIALLGGCATIPKPLEGTYTDITTSSAQEGGAGGTRVRWGGEIIKTEPGPQQTCFYLLSRPLDAQARPRSVRSGGDKGLATDPRLDPAATVGYETSFVSVKGSRQISGPVVQLGSRSDQPRVASAGLQERGRAPAGR